MTLDIHVRRATEADAEALGVVHVQAWREAYAGIVPDDILKALDPAQRTVMWQQVLTGAVVVQLAEQGGVIIGFGSSGPQLDASLPYSGEIHAIYVLQRTQRLGIGRALMAAMARDLLAQGHLSATLWVLEANQRARRFYEQLGGREVARKYQERDGFGAVGIAYGWDDVTMLT
jgi:ribosomal protein S18 acetylase RimI-like enzyme